jgi:hypothetical protein
MKLRRFGTFDGIMLFIFEAERLFIFTPSIIIIIVLVCFKAKQNDFTISQYPLLDLTSLISLEMADSAVWFLLLGKQKRPVS